MRLHFYVRLFSLLTFKTVLMTLILAFMKVYFSLLLSLFFLIIGRELRHHVPCKWLPTNDGLFTRNVVQLCLAVWLQIFCSRAKQTTLSPSCDRSCVEMGKFHKTGFALSLVLKVRVLEFGSGVLRFISSCTLNR